MSLTVSKVKVMYTIHNIIYYYIGHSNFSVIRSSFGLVRRQKHVLRINVKRIRRVLRKVPSVQHAFTCALQEAVNRRHAAYKEYKAARKIEEQNMRENFQGTLTKAIALKKGTDEETVVPLLLLVLYATAASLAYV
jgi:hypothetical protein